MSCLSRGILGLVSIGVLCAGEVAHADLIEFTTEVDGAQAADCAGTGSSGIGSGTLTLDTATGIVSFNITFSGLGSPESVAHVHGPAAECVGANSIYGLPAGSPKIGSSPVLTAQEQADMLAGLHYVNIHSDTFSLGEIRGQIVQVPAIPTISQWGLAIMTLLVVALAAIVIGRQRATKAA